MKESLKQRILDYLRRNFPRVISGGELERLAMENNFKASNCSRRARELENEGKITASYENGFVSYQYKEKQTSLV